MLPPWGATEKPATAFSSDRARIASVYRLTLPVPCRNPPLPPHLLPPPCHTVLSAPDCTPALNHGLARQRDNTHRDTVNSSFFENPNLIPQPSNNPAQFAFAPNGIYYQTNSNGGGSLYYSAINTIGAIEKQKAARSEALDLIFRNLCQADKNIADVYLNTFDSIESILPLHQ
jgi:hypothetical protein